MTFTNLERIALLESKFHFQIAYCNVTTVALFQIRNADWFIIDMRRQCSSTCKSQTHSQRLDLSDLICVHSTIKILIANILLKVKKQTVAIIAIL